MSWCNICSSALTKRFWVRATAREISATMQVPRSLWLSKREGEQPFRGHANSRALTLIYDTLAYGGVIGSGGRQTST